MDTPRDFLNEQIDANIQIAIKSGRLPQQEAEDMNYAEKEIWLENHREYFTEPKI